MKLFYAALLAASFTLNIFLFRDNLDAHAQIQETNKQMQEANKQAKSWQTMAASQDAQLLQQQEIVRASTDKLVACISKFGLQ